MSDFSDTSIIGDWVNQVGSGLTFKQSGTELSGHYRTSVGNADKGKSYPIRGWRNGRCLGFSVSWQPESDSITSWAGLIQPDESGDISIHTVWVLVSGSKLAEKNGQTCKVSTQPWEAFGTQTSIFSRASKTPSNS